MFVIVPASRGNIRCDASFEVRARASQPLPSMGCPLSLAPHRRSSLGTVAEGQRVDQRRDSSAVLRDGGGEQQHVEYALSFWWVGALYGELQEVLRIPRPLARLGIADSTKLGPTGMARRRGPRHTIPWAPRTRSDSRKSMSTKWGCRPLIGPNRRLPWALHISRLPKLPRGCRILGGQEGCQKGISRSAPSWRALF